MVRHKDDGYSEEKDVKTCPRDSGYDSLSNRLSILDRLLHTHPIWLQLGLSEDEAAGVLRAQPPGVRLRIGEAGGGGQGCRFLKEKDMDFQRALPSLQGAQFPVCTSLHRREVLEAAPRNRALRDLSFCLPLPGDHVYPGLQGNWAPGS